MDWQYLGRFPSLCTVSAQKGPWLGKPSLNLDLPPDTCVRSDLTHPQFLGTHFYFCFMTFSPKHTIWAVWAPLPCFYGPRDGGSGLNAWLVNLWEASICAELLLCGSNRMPAYTGHAHTRPHTHTHTHTHTRKCRHTIKCLRHLRKRIN